MKYFNYFGLYFSAGVFSTQAPLWIIALGVMAYFGWRVYYQNNSKEMR